MLNDKERKLLVPVLFFSVYEPIMGVSHSENKTIATFSYRTTTVTKTNLKLLTH